ncbi:ATP-grasp domain-containing protein [Lentisalinibacter sediminis]|uniref:ATP-grasp domain-containing protein n=2 Tax=Lentisalinibacter sediminis TaxID=2992237 RepID=UPI00386C47A1
MRAGVHSETMRNVFVLGLDEFNKRELRSIREAEACRFVGLLGYDEIVRPENGEFHFEALRRQAEEQLDGHGGSVDGIIAFWDFPSSAMAGVLRNARGLPGPSNEAIARCEHKYWSRIEQRAVVPELVPAFQAVDPFADDPAALIELDYPFWIKPVKAHSSRLGFLINGPEDLRAHLPEIRDKIGFFGRPFDEYLQHVEVPCEIRRVTGHWCIAEAIISAGRQCTLEGYAYQGAVQIYGVVDSVRTGRHRSCFSRYQYPSGLPRRVQARMIHAAEQVMQRFRYDCGAFNMEFYWHPETDRISLLEVNARISKSHCPLFRLVDGASHQSVAVDLALDEDPRFPQRQGEYRVAAKFMVRVFCDDGIVRAMPTAAELDRVSARYPEARFRPLAEPGERLRDSHHYDSYSYELGDLFLGAGNQRELLHKYRDCMAMLSFEVEPTGQDAA